jgi:hypothetical protein
VNWKQLTSTVSCISNTCTIHTQLRIRLTGQSLQKVAVEERLTDCHRNFAKTVVEIDEKFFDLEVTNERKANDRFENLLYLFPDNKAALCELREIYSKIEMWDSRNFTHVLEICAKERNCQYLLDEMR